MTLSRFCFTDFTYWSRQLDWCFIFPHHSYMFPVLCWVAQCCPTLCGPMDCSPPGFSVLWILQAKVLEWVAMPSSRGSSQPRDRTQVSCIAGGFFTISPIREALMFPTSTYKELLKKSPCVSRVVFHPIHAWGNDLTSSSPCALRQASVFSSVEWECGRIGFNLWALKFNDSMKPIHLHNKCRGIKVASPIETKLPWKDIWSSFHRVFYDAKIVFYICYNLVLTGRVQRWCKRLFVNLCHWGTLVPCDCKAYNSLTQRYQYCFKVFGEIPTILKPSVRYVSFTK